MTDHDENIKWHKINCLGLKCPLPVLRLEKALLSGKTHIELIADDPISVIDIPLAAIKNDCVLEETKKSTSRFSFFVIKNN